MAGVVVGVRRSKAHDPAVLWGAAEASLRNLPLTLVHAWAEPLDVSLDLEPDSLPESVGKATSCAVHGRAAAVLLAREPELLVLGGHLGTQHASHLTRSCLHHAACPVVIVPDHDRSTTSRIVVGVGSAETAAPALRWAAEAAALREARLVVVHAWQVHPHSAKDVLHPSGAAPAQQAAELERLRDLMTDVLGSAHDVELHATHGAPLDVLIDLSGDADLLVLGGRTHTGIGRLLHGAVGDDLSGLAPCPVAVIPARRTTTNVPGQ